ncbi:MAG: hypothetical protein UU18_C0004G0022 [Parcubacteria group bacterium GW2011_GWB2_40_8]|nr:MAG: hypothetical protein UT71_C0007G0022 [Parcubacteria group bacterium GW2011_GWF2_40_10]KKR47774.1 MAG: hypothetical protein UT83_C0004G0022 [Parcubacteria group bacterium GW2011_GWA2_40_143]KKR60108.1 MAG: hypothetical protein UT97_C0005G0022 [Parcubacteria group bacterium GW2011_GWC2_40_31]KKR75500.1 MAG: hypothetical protein UU18_C0004G0022 [Parcubacteria group bacterium GW2011_GWB2_40_8]KKR77681.1 MAG: hypothetical protein UU20_C0002G0003 [Parcubacteria group bacterium GW2011_GWE2_40_
MQIIAEQMDSLLGRVQTLETKQIESTQNIEQTNLEIERLKLENENLRLKNESLSGEMEKISQQVSDNQKSIDTVNQCVALEKPRICAQYGITIANQQINSHDLPAIASLSDVLSVLTPDTYYAKNQTDEICWKFGGWKEDLSQGEKCRSRESYIQGFNQDQVERRRQGAMYLKQGTEILESSQAQFDGLQCEALLKKYVPNRSAPGCG